MMARCLGCAPVCGLVGSTAAFDGVSRSAHTSLTLRCLLCGNIYGSRPWNEW